MSNKERLIEIIATELIGNLPIHKGPFISQAEARRLAQHDNEKRFKLAEEIADALCAEPEEGQTVYIRVKTATEADAKAHYMAGGYQGVGTFFLKEITLPKMPTASPIDEHKYHPLTPGS